MSRELYDACRTYKHFYRKYRDVQEWSHKYHDIDLSDAVNMTFIQLNESRDNLQKILFREYKVKCTNIDMSYDEPLIPVGRFGRCMPSPFDTHHADVDFLDSGEFLKVLSEYMFERFR